MFIVDAFNVAGLFGDAVTVAVIVHVNADHSVPQYGQNSAEQRFGRPTIWTIVIQIGRSPLTESTIYEHDERFVNDAQAHNEI